LTGGTARLSGIAEAAQLALGLEARVAEGPRDVAPELSQPEYSTALGLLHYALTGQEEVRKNLKPVGLLRRISSLLNFD
jgi:cell division protein FtsA